MKHIVQIVILIVLLYSCSYDCGKYKSIPGKYNISEMYSLIDVERKFLHENGQDTIYSIDSFYVYLSNYRNKLISILKKEELPVNFNKGFLLEDFFVYKKDIRKYVPKDSPYDYRAVIYFENTKYKIFLDINISKDCRKYYVDRVKMNKERDTTIFNWINDTINLERQNLKYGIVDQWADQYDIITKLTNDEKFSRVVINYFWNGFYGITEKPLVEKQKATWKKMEHIGYLMYLTGHGFSF